MFETREESRGMMVTYHIPLPECKQELELIQNASNMYSALWDLKQMLRQGSKHDEFPKYEGRKPETAIEMFGAIEDKFYEILEENNVDLDM